MNTKIKEGSNLLFPITENNKNTYWYMFCFIKITQTTNLQLFNAPLENEKIHQT